MAGSEKEKLVKTGKGPKKAAGNLPKGPKPIKNLKTVMEKKPVRKIVEYYYFTDQEINARNLLAATGEYDPKSDIWPDLNLMEVEMKFDSLIFQDAAECFIDPEDLAWMEAHQIKAKYQISYDTGDIEDVRKVMKNIMSVCGGVICSDTDDFEPSYTVDQLEQLGK